MCMLTILAKVNELRSISVMTSRTFGSHEAEPEAILEVLMILGKSDSAQETNAGQEFSASQHTCSFLPLAWV